MSDDRDPGGDPRSTLPGRRAPLPSPSSVGRTFLWLLLAAAPFLWTTGLVFVYAVDVPFWDQWDFVPLFAAWVDGKSDPPGLDYQHGEHRPLFPHLLFLGLASVSKWNIRWECFASVVLAAAMLGAIASWLRRRMDPGAALPLLGVTSLFVFSPAAWESWVWGWQAQLFLCLAAAITALLLLAEDQIGPLRLGAAWLLTFVASFSFTYGLLVLPLGTFLVAIPARNRWPRVVAWTFGACVLGAVYFSGFRPPAYLESSGLDLDTALATASFFLVVLGVPLVPWSMPGAAIVSVSGLAAFMVLTVREGRRSRDPLLRGLVAVALLSLGSSALIAFGRSPFGLDHATSTRYATITLLFWLVLALLATLELRGLPAVRQRARLRQWIVAAILIFGGLGYVHGTQSIRGAHRHLDTARQGLIEFDEALMRRLHPDVELVRERAMVLKERQLSLFRER
jgi:hypothetical protein